VSGPLDVTYAVNFGAGRQDRREGEAFSSDRQIADGKTAGHSIPRIARLMALAILPSSAPSSAVRRLPEISV
jgi:hypothetical protein